MEKDEQQVEHTPAINHVARASVSFLILLGVWGGLLFWAAGTFLWTRGWVNVGLWVVALGTNLGILLRTNPDVIAARMNRQHAFARFEKVMLPFFVPAVLAIPVVAGLDAVRYAWTPLPPFVMCPGVIVHVAGDAFMLWAMMVNPYLTGEVRIQTERGHRVISTGPYAIVRHPMYTGLILVLAGIPLLLGSSWAFVPTSAVALLLVIRMLFEDRMLRKELPGYEAYTLRTPHRLIPGVW
ncbi:MAG: isoprenylcysteine carboxylmethyltransferase family protein [bacterium]|nr:isoprenylcysteine carboxylmethyltransferase family protein [bacterium]